MDLEEWTIHYIKHRDLFHRKLESYEKEEGMIVFKFKDKTHYYFLKEEITEELFKEVKGKEWVTVVCSYKEKNMDFVVKNWAKLIDLKNFLIIFVVPDSGKKLLLSPSAHHSIADPESLEMGLRSMFSAGLES